jgi:hypothetical protein
VRSVIPFNPNIRLRLFPVMPVALVKRLDGEDLADLGTEHRNDLEGQ